MDQDASESGFEFVSHHFLRSWYLRDGKKSIPTLDQAHSKEMIEEGQMQTPLQLVALIHGGHSMIHKPWWSRVFLPILCPTSLALEEMYKHWFYSTKLNEGRVLKFSLASMKMAFHLGYTIQVFWILTTKRPLGPLPTAAQHEPTTNFFDSEPNIREWEYIQLSAKEEAWYGISGDGPGTMSPLALGLKEAERVQRHWEKEQEWVYPMYPAEWEGWAVV
ncbi:hypothetical protein NEUTE1DRAFT_40294 [Neurospora tetrasperma FGSC 2508]|uniref:Uncharacterized protein n=1 Tax=Neurospora tetrasperma (strain FGSC 2508 / ATCC MYA-4615 / P0657) TaxID=510951 RepID=F8MG02_NEUT8|nr:uncharacterized protein NEUTE1DRAFT_40294 [Neurospora tetrasperma FGSC 2508]EGO58530.1 hypothetical protein NEUTE1DRAFT_40294 [Neurospora tetrasperma FGSC 2508]EGZ72595.1 hypothetical protein NEUTE2DRAFT_126978 [Neurospora tetrasperma FGSC 2509]